MKIDVRHDGPAATMRLSGRFDMRGHKSFNDAHRPVLAMESVRALTLELDDVDYIDSSALGMLLLLQRMAEKKNIEITLSNAQPQIRSALKLANFQKMFKIV